ncbi:hypothetical protein UFOVP515_11 [uncultured Caudovirales phage]|uniref:Uncharacterized protein n=1 Tax=uncultured Caudovirales phage TaxID=2100421 RepID=A0A6J5MNR6_9CAUD|nr:hypothetical protein UFOVP515_11 [uncultured Caudovirales phage]
MTNFYQQLQTPAVPDLPNPQDKYDRLTVAQTNGALRTFFLKLTNALQSIASPRGGRFINMPYGAFQDSTDQTAANTTTAYAITFDTTDFNNGVTLSNSSRLNVSQSGIYNIQFSVQFKNTTNDTQDVDVWFKKNGTNIDNSNSRFGLPARKSSGDPSHLISAMNFFVSMETNDYIEIMWRPSDVGVSIEHFATSSTPTRPAIPSVITTVTFVSNLSA